MSIQQENRFQAIISHAKEYGFVFPGSEIYDGLSAVYDYGPYGSELKKNIRDYWWKSMTQMHENIVGIDAAIFMHPTTWKASGHVDNFNDPMIDNKDSKKRYRVDHLIEEYLDLLLSRGDRYMQDYWNITMWAERVKIANGDSGYRTVKELEDFAKEKSSDIKKAHEIKTIFDNAIASDDFETLKQIIVENNINVIINETSNWTDIRQFNLMFSTQIGSVAGEADTIYLRPETAQGIFVNFLNVQKTARMKIPFGIAQVGKAFRNEIVARQFIFRMREFEQMEMQFFVRPGMQKEWYEYWKDARLKWHLSLGIPAEKYRYHSHTKPAHYADAALDIEYEFPFGFKEVEGIHSRTDFDLSNHQKYSGKKLTYFDTEINQHYIPYVIETSIGLDRMLLLILCHAYDEETIVNDEGKTDTRAVMRIPAKIAPIKLAILPLVKKDGLPEIARILMNKCKEHYRCYYEEKDTIGRRYRRQDAIGTPFCATIDKQTKEDGTVTLRHRDTMLQERIHIDKVAEKISALI